MAPTVANPGTASGSGEELCGRTVLFTSHSATVALSNASTSAHSTQTRRPMLLVATGRLLSTAAGVRPWPRATAIHRAAPSGPLQDDLDPRPPFGDALVVEPPVVVVDRDPAGVAPADQAEQVVQAAGGHRLEPVVGEQADGDRGG